MVVNSRALLVMAGIMPRAGRARREEFTPFDPRVGGRVPGR